MCGCESVAISQLCRVPAFTRHPTPACSPCYGVPPCCVPNPGDTALVLHSHIHWASVHLWTAWGRVNFPGKGLLSTEADSWGSGQLSSGQPTKTVAGCPAATMPGSRHRHYGGGGGWVHTLHAPDKAGFVQLPIGWPGRLRGRNSLPSSCRLETEAEAEAGASGGGAEGLTVGGLPCTQGIFSDLGRWASVSSVLLPLSHEASPVYSRPPNVPQVPFSCCDPHVNPPPRGPGRQRLAGMGGHRPWGPSWL